MKVSNRISFGNIPSSSQFYRDIEKEIEANIKNHHPAKAQEILSLYNTANRLTPFHEVIVMPHYSIVDYISSSKPAKRVRNIPIIKFYPFNDASDSSNPYIQEVKYNEHFHTITPIKVKDEIKYQIKSKIGGSDEMYGIGGIEARLQDIIKIAKKLKNKDKDRIKRLRKYETWYMKSLDKIQKYKILSELYKGKAEALQAQLKNSHFE